MNVVFKNKLCPFFNKVPGAKEMFFLFLEFIISFLNFLSVIIFLKYYNKITIGY